MSKNLKNKATAATLAKVAKPGKPSRPSRDEQRRQEDILVAELLANHGYAFTDFKKPDDRISFSFTKTKAVTMRVVRLHVPVDSSLAKRLDQLQRQISKGAARGIMQKAKR